MHIKIQTRCVFQSKADHPQTGYADMIFDPVTLTLTRRPSYKNLT